MAKSRNLLALGNGKLGQQAAHFDVPAGEGYCPGATAVCLSHCYALKSRFKFTNVKDRLKMCYEESQKPDFERKIIREIRERGLLLVRLHTAGDYYSEQYALRWLRIMRMTPRVKYWWYSRSWRVPAIESVLREMALLPNVRGWYSIDRDAKWEGEVPTNIRLAYLQTDLELPEKADLVFRTKGMLTGPRIPLPMILCPTDSPKGRKDAGINCGSCGLCLD